MASDGSAPIMQKEPEMKKSEKIQENKTEANQALNIQRFVLKRESGAAGLVLHLEIPLNGQEGLLFDSAQIGDVLKKLQLPVETQGSQNGLVSPDASLNGNGKKVNELKFVADFILRCKSQYVLLVIKRILTVRIREVLLEEAKQNNKEFSEKNYEFRDNNWYETWNEKLKTGGRTKRYRNLKKVFSKAFDESFSKQLIELLNKAVNKK